VREDAEGCRQKGKPIDDAEEQLQGHDGVDQFRQEALRDYGVFFDELGEVV
jgi:hypothetical protein